MAPCTDCRDVSGDSRQSAPFTIRAKAKSRTAKPVFSALFAGDFPCLRGGEPIFSRGRIHDRTYVSKPAMRAVLDIVLIVLDLYVWLLIASAILSWLIAFNVVNTRNQFVAAVAEFLYRITEPVLAP